MALKLALKRGAISDDLTYFLVEDSTGNYDAALNPGGYGSPNPARASMALFVYGYKYHKDVADTALAITNNTAPETAASWQVGMSLDGYHYIRIVGVNDWDAIVNYIVDQIVYYQNKFYIATQASINLDPVNNTSSWAEITDLTTDAVYTNTSVYVFQLDTVINSRGKKCLQTAVFKKAKEDCNCSGTAPGPVMQPYMKIYVHLNAANYNYLQEKYALADDELKYLSEYCASIECGC